MPVQATTQLPDAQSPTLGNGVEDEIAADVGDNTDNGDFRFQIRETGQSAWNNSAAGFAEAVVASDADTSGTVSTTFIGLEDGEKYESRVRSETGHVTGTWTSPVSIVTQFPGATSLTATVVSPTQIDLSWTDNADNEDGFIVERREQFASGFGAWRERADLAPNTTSYTDGVLPETTYEYRIRAYTEHTTATSSSIQTTSNDDGVRTDRVPAEGWHVVLEDGSGNGFEPSITTSPSFRPTLNGLPTVEIPVANPDRWDQPAFEEAPLRVYLDGDRLPIDTFVTVDRSTSQAVLKGRGGSELRRRVERNYESQPVHTASDDLITGETSYATDIDVPATETLTGQVLQSADTDAEFANRLLTEIAATDPLEVSGGTISVLQTCFVSEGEDEDRGSGGTSERQSDYSAGIAGTVDSTGEYAEFDITPGYTIPEEHVGVAIKDYSGDFPGVEVTLNGDIVDSVTAAAGSVSDSWTHMQDGFYDGDGYDGGDLAAGSTYTLRIECTDGGGGLGEYYDFDVVAIYDSRYSYTWDETVDADGYFVGPELYPASVDVVMEDAVTAYSVTGADHSSTLNSTANNQQVAVSNDFGASWTTADNSGSVAASFAERGGSVRTRFRLSRQGSRSTATPTSGFEGQSVDAYTLEADLDDVATLVNRSYDGRITELLADIADYGDLVWEVRYDDGFEVIVTRPGIRTADVNPDLVDYTVTKDSSQIVTRAVVYGKSQPVRGEAVIANHGTAVELAQDHLTETSEVVRDASSGVTYARNVDYRIDPQAGTLTTLASGSILDGQSLEMDYEHRSRGVFEADSHNGNAGRELSRTIPAATTDRACQQAALKIVQTADESRWTADATVADGLSDVPLSSALDLDGLPTRGETLEVWDVEDQPDGVSLQLGNRDSITEVVDDIRSRLEAVARLS